MGDKERRKPGWEHWEGDRRSKERPTPSGRRVEDKVRDELAPVVKRAKKAQATYKPRSNVERRKPEFEIEPIIGDRRGTEQRSINKPPFNTRPFEVIRPDRRTKYSDQKRPPMVEPGGRGVLVKKGIVPAFELRSGIERRDPKSVNTLFQEDRMGPRRQIDLQGGRKIKAKIKGKVGGLLGLGIAVGTALMEGKRAYDENESKEKQ